MKPGAVAKERHAFVPRLLEPAFAGEGEGEEDLLLRLHSALDIEEIWEAFRRLAHATLPVEAVCFGVRPFQLLPGSYYRDRFALKTAEELQRLLVLCPWCEILEREPERAVLRLSDSWSERQLAGSDFYAEFMRPYGLRYLAGLAFRDKEKNLCGLVGLYRKESQGDFTEREMGRLQELHPPVSTAIGRVLRLHREQVVRFALEKFLQHLPLPTAVLNWNLEVMYQNRAALAASAAWEHGARAARQFKLRPPLRVPEDVLAACRRVKESAHGDVRHNVPTAPLHTRTLAHPRQPGLHASITLLPFGAGALQRPVLLVQFETRGAAGRGGEGAGERGFRAAQQLGRLTPSEQELALLVCEGRSNDEIAGELCKSVLTVKKQLQSVFQKLEVPSRARLIAMLR